MRVKDGKGETAYKSVMSGSILRLLVTIALVLMPLGMGSGQAVAAPIAEASAAGHCEDHQQPAEAPSGFDVHCASCVALPTVPRHGALECLLSSPALAVAFAKQFNGIEPEVATPPPKDP